MTTLGKVYLVGAGPGDPGLLTLKGLWCLQQADLVLYDGLVNPLLLRHTRAQAERTCRSSTPAGRRLNQAEINERLIEAARAGQTVVRLKGGDPFIFGRGSEEASALAEAGIPFEVVPGITAAIAAGDYAGMSFTHRELASAVAFVTGHEDPAKAESSLDYRALAAFPGTLVFYMGLNHLEFIAQSLIQAGMNADTPAAVVSRATLPAQQTVTAPLQDLPAAVREAGLHAPSLIVVGQCVLQREKIAWFEARPLFGKTVGITRPEEQASPALERALELGAQPVLLPAIRIEPPESWGEIDRTLDRLDQFDWLIFTSVNGVRGLLDRLWETGRDVRPLASLKLAAIGSSTAAMLAAYRLRADLVPGEFRAEALAAALKPRTAGRRVLWACASRGRDVLPRELEQAGATVERLVVYRNLDAESLPADALALIESGRLDWIGLSSPSIARRLKSLLTPAALQHIGTSVKLASISPVTSAAAQEAGLPIQAEAAVYTWDGIFAAIVEAETGDSE